MAFSKTINFSITIAAIFFVSFTIVNGGGPNEKVSSSSAQLLGTEIIHDYIGKHGINLPSGKVGSTGQKIVVQKDKVQSSNGQLLGSEVKHDYIGKNGIKSQSTGKVDTTGQKIVVQENDTENSEDYELV
ncbi:uncharacterized protein LOC126845777 isoform X2 [Adelges cooleyi]|uniref:uncharacterized protein LOC126845777 isoform X2 n=1 Tax=Adelges cooleyi TaxID=133065 RepID=UPI0021805493|nr:uncharacterized protein LOC126845777 isoform X2 [Adelges cooleyi]